jgi:hypothetical protein
LPPFAFSTYSSRELCVHISFGARLQVYRMIFPPFPP